MWTVMEHKGHKGHKVLVYGFQLFVSSVSFVFEHR
jgi:hypothetical protein